MKRINDREVELTKGEQEAKNLFDLMLDEGIPTATAARYAVTSMPARAVRKDFVEWLSDGTLTKTDGKLVEVAVA
jgi:hypothetical protein